MVAEDACIGVSQQVASNGKRSLGLRVQNLREVAQLNWYARMPAVPLLNPIEHRCGGWLIHEVVSDCHCTSKALCDMGKSHPPSVLGSSAPPCVSIDHRPYDTILSTCIVHI